MASFAKDILVHKCYRKANGGSTEELHKLLKEEKAKNPKRIPYFFSASRKFPGKFCLGYQPGSKPRVEYVTVTPDGFRYRNRVRDSVDSLIRWFKEHYQDPLPKPSASQMMAAHGSVNPAFHTAPPSSVSSSHIPSRTPRNHDFSRLQATVNTGNQRNLTGNTPYTPTHLTYSSSAWRSGGGGVGWDSGRTPTQTPGRSPMYAPPTQATPHSMGSYYGTSAPSAGGAPLSGKDGHGRNHVELPGTPVLDE